MSKAALKYAQKHQADYLEQLKALLKIPGISTQTEHTSDIKKTAEWLMTYMEAIGLQNVALYPTELHPVVYADWLNAGPDAPTVLIYGHYDVQPPDPLDLWTTPPFEPTVRGDDIFARGATDDKGQLFVHLAAVDAVMRTDGKLPVNVKIILEGEEEIGSLHLEAFVAAHADLLAADCAVISDTAFVSPGQPAMVYGVRGLAALEVSVQTAKQDLHSGIYGGAVHNPLQVLAEIISALHTPTGEITVPGFYDDVLPLDAAERELIAALPDTLQQETGVRKLWGEPDFTPMERTVARPTVEVHGFVGGYTGEGTKTVIPALAKAKLSMRLVPNQEPKKAYEQLADYIRQLAPDTVTVTTRLTDTGLPGVINLDDPAIVAASNAFEAVFGKAPVFNRSGGSIPVVAMMQHYLNLPVAMIGFGLTDDNLHAPNEKFHLPNFYGGIQTVIHFMDEYARLKSE